jgi:hypothetical protein
MSTNLALSYKGILENTGEFVWIWSASDKAVEIKHLDDSQLELPIWFMENMIQMLFIQTSLQSNISKYMDYN